MRIKMLSIDCGPGGNRQPGDIVEVSDEEGQALIDGRYAVPADGAVEKAEPPSDFQRIEQFLDRSAKEIIGDVGALGTVSACDLAAAAEAKGRNRTTVLDAVAGRRQELEADAEADFMVKVATMSAEEATAAETAEQAGAQRPAVLEAIAARLKELAPPADQA